MKLADLIQTFQDRPFFETRDLNMLFDEPASQVQARVSRWVRQGRLVQLRRGKYLLADEFRRSEASLYFISNILYRPSYVSLHSALEYHGLIPEAVGVVQAVTTRHGAEWENPLGRFGYHGLKPDRFWGYREYGSGRESPPPHQRRFLMAVPEKAVIDLFYLYAGEWSLERIEEMRFQNLEQIDREALLRAAERFDSPKVVRGVHCLLAWSEESEGE